MIINSKVMINRPSGEVWEYFSNSENLKDWIEGLKDYHHISGDIDSIGAIGVYEYRGSGETIELRNEVLHLKKEEEFTSSFHHKDYEMIINFSFFKENDGSATSIICNTEYDFKTFFWKVFAKMFKDKMQFRQKEDLLRLKALVEMAPVHK